MRQEAKKYADNVCGENDEYLKIYHAYEDGYSAGKDLHPNSSFVVGILIGIILGLALISVLHDVFHIFNCKPI